MGSLFDKLKDHPGDNLIDQFVYVNVPVCDLDQVVNFIKGKKSLIWHLCVNCAQLKLGNSKWPYKYGP